MHVDLEPQNGKTEYKSITYAPDATAEEFMDMYFDDDNRPNWVSQGRRVTDMCSQRQQTSSSSWCAGQMVGGLSGCWQGDADTALVFW